MIAWFTRHPVAANLLMIALLVAGFISADNMRKEIIPKLPSSTININAYYEGHTAEQIDIEIGQKIEQALQGIAGIKHVNSVSSQNSLSVTVKKKLDYSMDTLLNDVKSKIDTIYDWPQLAEKPQVEHVEDTYSALMVQLSGNTDNDSLIKQGDRLKRALLANPAIHKITSYGAHDYGIYINVFPDKMRQYKLSFDDISFAIQQQSVRSKSGVLKTDNGQFLIYSEQHSEYQRELKELVVKTSANGNIVLLSDIAQINDGFIEHDSDIRFNGQPTIAFEVKMSDQSDVLEISAQTKIVIARFNESLPDNLQLHVWFDASIYVQERLDLLQNNAFQGFLLVFIILSLFLQMRLAFWVAMGLPVAIAGTFIILGQLGLQYTINEVTTFGFILVLGILVDDAVVVGESVYTSKQQGGDDLTSTIRGVHKVAMPTVFGVLTTVAALLPMTHFPSEAGRLFAGFAWVIIIALLFSLLESKFILPSHLRYIDINKRKKSPSSVGIVNWLVRLRQSPQHLLNRFNNTLYIPFLGTVLRYRYAWLMSFFTIAIAILGAMYQGQIRTALFPEVPGDLMVLVVELEVNAPLHLTKNAMLKVESIKNDINKKYQNDYSIAENIISKNLSIMDESGSITVFAELIPKKYRHGISIKEIAELWRNPVANLPGVISTEMMITESGTSAGSAIILQHPDIKVLDKIVQQTTQWLESQPGVRNVKDAQQSTIPQLAFSLKPEAQLYGITPKMLSNQLAAAYNGMEVDRFYRDNHRVKVYLTLPRSMRDARMDFKQMYIFNENRESFPLLAIADMEPMLVQNSISRHNGLLSRTLALDIDKSVTSPDNIDKKINKDFYGQIIQQYPLFSKQNAGELEEIDSSKDGLKIAFFIALLAIYVLLALPLKRYGQPLIIMAAIPFGVVGAILGHVWLDLTVSLYSFLGVLALSGVVVNDSLLIVTCYNEQRGLGLTKTQAVTEACNSRFRAIFLTTITTFAGLYPLLNESSEQAQYLIPAAVSLAYGLVFASLITLFLIPILLLVSSDIKDFITLENDHDGAITP
jgi:multidrug efflux pump subunit AcrB